MQNTAPSDFWQLQVAEQAQLDLSAAAFCRERSLVYHQFLYWRRRFNVSHLQPSKAASGFTRVTHRQTDIASSTGLSVTLPSGVQITGFHAGNIGSPTQ